MPLVDGGLSARMIRLLEKESKHRHTAEARDQQISRQRAPIIAVSASLSEENRFEYIENGYVFTYFTPKAGYTC
jgi:hypothetical protein